MSAIDATRLIESRFTSLEDRVVCLRKDRETDREELVVLKHAVEEMTEAFKAFRTALYAAAGSILVAAMLVVMLGK